MPILSTQNIVFHSLFLLLFLDFIQLLPRKLSAVSVRKVHGWMLYQYMSHHCGVTRELQVVQGTVDSILAQVDLAMTGGMIGLLEFCGIYCLLTARSRFVVNWILTSNRRQTNFHRSFRLTGN